MRIVIQKHWKPIKLIKDNMIVNPRDTLTEIVTQCACGRSPTGRCVGWHNLTEEQFKEQL